MSGVRFLRAWWGVFALAVGLALAALLGGCVSPVVRETKDAAVDVVKVAREEATVAARDVLKMGREEIAVAVANVDTRVNAKLDAVLAESREYRVLAEKALAVADRAVTTGAAESEKWRGIVAPVAAAFAQPAGAVSSAPAPGSPPSLPAEERYALYAALAGAVFTMGKTGWRLWKSKGAAHGAAGVRPNADVPA